MIERTFIAQKTREYFIRKFVEEKLGNVGISSISLKKIPLGEKIIINTSRPSLIVGSKGANIRSLTKTLKEKFNLENPQIEINEVKNIFLDANVVAERIVSSLERFGSARFKGIGHKMMENVMNAGALGVEITVSGKVPSARARSWRFYTGYLKKCGDVALSVRTAKKAALLKSGILGIKVAIMPPDIVLPDKTIILEELEQVVEEVKKEPVKKEAPKKRASRKKSNHPVRDVPSGTKEASQATEVAEAKETAAEDKQETTEVNEAS
ncbi:30S ribosomal protein S3 [Candidatus Woesearchaeota archaeon]|nr:30S ribosomal protein S3 [Candidatus Woesearchaeota archaeon]MBI2581803.1 30S ribosomal protein S3 [Candidatus Woesearchaeota archaeon]